MTPTPGAVSFFVAKLRISGRVTASGGGLHALAGLPDGAGLVLMDPAEVPNQLKRRRRAARDHQPAFGGVEHGVSRK